MIKSMLNFLIHSMKPLTTEQFQFLNEVWITKLSPRVQWKKPSDVLPVYTFKDLFTPHKHFKSLTYLTHIKMPINHTSFLSHTCRWLNLNDLQSSPPGKNPRRTVCIIVFSRLWAEKTTRQPQIYTCPPSALLSEVTNNILIWIWITIHFNVGQLLLKASKLIFNGELRLVFGFEVFIGAPVLIEKTPAGVSNNRVFCLVCACENLLKGL